MEVPCGRSPPRCKLCCWYCEHLSECNEGWKHGMRYCKINFSPQWCSVCYNAYEKGEDIGSFDDSKVC